MLEQHGLVELGEERRKGNVTERLLQAAAASYVISPSALAAVAPDPARAPDRLSARWLLALAAQLVRDVGDLITGATRAPRQLPTFAMDGTGRFASAAHRSGQAPDGRFIAYEFLIEGRAGGSTVLRTVTSGFLPGEDWAEEFEAMTLGGELYFRTLVEYLTYFAGRFATPVTAFGPPGPSWSRDRSLLCRELGLAETPQPGDPVRFTGEIGPADGGGYFSTP